MTSLYLLSQDVNSGRDTYDSCVVAANSPDEARNIHPSKTEKWKRWDSDTWVSIENREEIDVVRIGVAKLPAGTLVLASYNAG